jgi:hypothetical protein
VEGRSVQRGEGGGHVVSWWLLPASQVRFLGLLWGGGWLDIGAWGQRPGPMVEGGEGTFGAADRWGRRG